MRFAVILLLTLFSLSVAQISFSARGKNENHILYTWDGLDYDIYQQDVGTIGYREVALGADTCFLYMEADEDTYDHLEVWLEWTADSHNGNFAATKTSRNVAIYWLQSLVYTARTVTAGNKLPIANFNSAGGVVDYIYRTLTPDSTSYANKRLIANLSGRLGETTGRVGPFWIDANDAADSTGSGFLMITADTVAVDWRAIVIPR